MDRDKQINRFFIAFIILGIVFTLSSMTVFYLKQSPFSTLVAFIMGSALVIGVVIDRKAWKKRLKENFK